MDRFSCSLRPLAAALCTISLSALCQGALVVLEPDDYAEGTVLNSVLPEATFGVSTTTGLGPGAFDLTANADGSATTGANAFGHANIPFFTTSRRIRMEFHVPITDLTIDYANSSPTAPQSGVLEVYDAGMNLIDTFTSAPVVSGTPATLSLSRPAGDIAFAVAYPDGGFGDFDFLRFEVVPEPSTGLLAGLAAFTLSFRRRRGPR